MILMKIDSIKLENESTGLKELMLRQILIGTQMKIKNIKSFFKKEIVSKISLITEETMNLQMRKLKINL